MNDDWSLLLHVLPLAAGAALSPAVLGASLEILVTFSSRGVRMLLAYLLGAALVVAGAIALAGVLPQRPATAGASQISDLVDVVLGALLLVLALVLIFRRPTARGGGGGGVSKRLLGSRWAAAGVAGLGVVMMITNFSTLVLVLAGAHQVSSAGALVRGVGYGMLAVGALVPILVPLVWVAVRPAAALRELGRVNAAITKHARAVGIVVCLLTAGYLLARGFGLI